MASAMRTEFEAFPVGSVGRHGGLFASLDAECMASDGPYRRHLNRVVQPLAAGATWGSSATHEAEAR